MRITFSAPSGGLRVIPEIPDLALARLEGRNGIGKSLAARLLELIAGEAPYAALPLAWNSLVDQLGRVDVRIEGVGTHVFEVGLDSAMWAHDRQQDAQRYPGTLLIDGVEAEWGEARRLLQVRRIAGDETLGETIGLSLHETGKAVDAQRRRVSATVSEWSEAWGTLCMPHGDPLAKARSLVTDLDDMLSQRKRVEEARHTLSEALDAARITGERLERLRDLEAASDDLLVYRDAWRERSELAAEIAKLESGLVRAAIGKALDKAAERSVERLLRLVRIRRDALARALFEEREVLRALDLAARPADEEGVSLLAQASSEREQIDRRLRTQHAAGTIRDTAGALEHQLSSLPNELERETIAELDRDVSIGELARGLKRRQLSLRGTPKSEVVLALEKDLARLTARISLLESLPAVIRAAERKSANLVEAESELEQLVRSTQSGRADRNDLSDELAAKRDKFAEITTQALVALVSLRTAAGLETAADAARSAAAAENSTAVGQDTSEDEQAQVALEAQLVTPEGLEADLVKISSACVRDVRAYGVVDLSDDWRGALGPALAQCASFARAQESELALRTQEASDLAGDIEAVLRELADLRSSAIEFADALLNDPTWAPLRDTANKRLGHRGHNIEDLPAWIERIRGALDTPSIDPGEEAVLEFASLVARAVQGLEEASTAVRDSWGVATAFVRREAHDLAPRLVQGISPDWHFSQLDESAEGRILRAWLEAEISNILSQDVLRRELFEDATEVEYDLRSRAVVWRSSDGRRRRRPLEAFSSGEQVFAYTRAKLETLRSLRAEAEHVLIFLDEFGAFVARERFGELMRYVQTDVLGDIADQVVVMLPSSDSALEFESRAVLAEYATEDYLVEPIASHGVK